MSRRSDSRTRKHCNRVHTALVSIAIAAAPQPLCASVWTFTDVTQSAGFNYQHGFVNGVTNDTRRFTGGVAAGDYDRDGWIDLYVVRGDIGPNLLFRNRGNGTFQEVGAAAGVNITGALGNGPVFGDYDGDGWLDLLVGGVEVTEPVLLRNLGNGTFQNVTASSGLVYTGDTYSSSFGDFDGDADIDIFMTHWGAAQFTGGHLWRNTGSGSFVEWDSEAGFSLFGEDLFEYTYTGTFADIDNDDDSDMLVAADFNTSEVYSNDGDGTFTETTTAAISDQFGMGSAVADYDNDGDLDWFVTSIWDTINDPEPGFTRDGNRLYKNQGNGTFTDVTDVARVRRGGWGWAASFADFNNDGFLDIYHVNGWRWPPHDFDPSRMFISNGNGVFTERSQELGVDDRGQGRGIACFDYDRDGDIDIFVANNSAAPILYRNNGGNAGAYVAVKLIGSPPNTEALGARVIVRTGALRQIREIHGGSNYVSQDPTEAHFGVGSATYVDSLRIEWPNGTTNVFTNLPVNHLMTFEYGNITAVEPGLTLSPPGGGLACAGSYPNPTTSAAAIRYTLQTPAALTLDIHDASGRLVRSIVQPGAAAGAHEIVWDGRDDARRLAVSGRYFYRLTTPYAAARGSLTVAR
jgi:hypothetical protein